MAPENMYMSTRTRGQVDAGEAGRRGVAADGIDGAAKVGVGHENVDDDRHDDQDHRQHRDAGPVRPPSGGIGQLGQEAALGQPGEVRLRDHADRLAFGRQQEGDAAKGGQRTRGWR